MEKETKKDFYEYVEDNIYYGNQGPNVRGANYFYQGSTYIKLIEESNDILSFEVESKYCSDEDWNLELFLNDAQCSSTEDVINKFIIKKENNLWKIKYFVLPN